MHVIPCKIELCFECVIMQLQDCIISKIDDDPRDKLAIRLKKLMKKSEKARKKYVAKKKLYLSSLAKPKNSIHMSKLNPIVSEISTKMTETRSWNTDRLNELSKPKADYYYECTNEIVVMRRVVKRVNIERINDLATPRKSQSDVHLMFEHRKRVPLSRLLPRLEKLAVPAKRPDASECLKSYTDTYSVKKSALKYVASERLKRLATPRPLLPEE